MKVKAGTQINADGKARLCAAFFAANLLLAYAGGAHAELGGAPARFEAGSTTSASSVAAAGSGYTLLDTALPTGTHVREYVARSGSVFAVGWDGPFLPDLQALLGAHFETMVAESAKTPRAGNSQLAVNRPDVVILSGGHMRAFEGRAWLPAELPAGLSASDIR